MLLGWRSVTETPFVGGAWPSGRARDLGSRIRRFDSSRPSHLRRGRQVGPRLTLLHIVRGSVASHDVGRGVAVRSRRAQGRAQLIGGLQWIPVASSPARRDTTTPYPSTSVEQ